MAEIIDFAAAKALRPPAAPIVTDAMLGTVAMAVRREQRDRWLVCSVRWVKTRWEVVTRFGVWGSREVAWRRCLEECERLRLGRVWPEDWE